MFLVVHISPTHVSDPQAVAELSSVFALAKHCLCICMYMASTKACKEPPPSFRIVGIPDTPRTETDVSCCSFKHVFAELPQAPCEA